MRVRFTRRRESLTLSLPAVFRLFSPVVLDDYPLKALGFWGVWVRKTFLLGSISPYRIVFFLENTKRARKYTLFLWRQRSVTNWFLFPPPFTFSPSFFPRRRFEIYGCVLSRVKGFFELKLLPSPLLSTSLKRALLPEKSFLLLEEVEPCHGLEVRKCPPLDMRQFASLQAEVVRRPLTNCLPLLDERESSPHLTQEALLAKTNLVPPAASPFFSRNSRLRLVLLFFF